VFQSSIRKGGCDWIKKGFDSVYVDTNRAELVSHQEQALENVYCIVSKNKKVDFLPAPAAVVTLPATGPAVIIVLASWVFSATPLG
jgi:hypothetical protein